ncbi:hypothetical protein vseg_006827 [Gypsophila vaccaria]
MDDDNKPLRKRKSSPDQFQQHPSKLHRPLLLADIDLNLSLSSSPSPTPPPPPPLPLIQPTTLVAVEGTSRRGSRAPVKTDRVTPPYRWATDRRAVVHSMDYLLSQGITSIAGDVQCKKCERSFEMTYDVHEKFRELVAFIVSQGGMQQRAPKRWIKPILPTCKYCGEEHSCKPVIAEKKRNINWLFLLLGQMLGCCTLEQLKYFCKHTHNHRTGAKDRVLFLSYYTLCKQLDPTGPYHFHF